MNINANLVNNLVDSIRQTFPNWQGFSDPQFEEAEVTYKKTAIAKAKQLLSKQELMRLIIDDANYVEVINRIKKVGQSTNLLFLGIPSTDDMSIIMQPNLDLPVFCQAFFDLLYGSGLSSERLDRYVAYVQSHHLPNKWTFPTYFLCMCYPETEMFVKPRTTKWFLKIVESDILLDSSPNGSVYAHVLELCKQLRDTLQMYHPRDYIDIQSFLWVAYSASDEKKKGLGKIDLEEGGDDVHYWKIAPGENAWNWEPCKQGGFILVGWGEMGDLTGITREELEDRYKKQQQLNDDWGIGGLYQLANLIKICPGDRIVANKGKKEVLGIGTVTGPYRYIPDTHYGHCIPVRWDDVHPRVVDKPGWMKTIIELTADEFMEISNFVPKNDMKDCFFDMQTFDLLNQLSQNPTQVFYSEHKQEFKDKVEQPFQDLMLRAAKQLRPEILEMMETEKNIFARIIKNDYGKGGTWDFYWGAFYPKGGKRTADPQLSLWINSERLEVGFFIGRYDEISKSRFQRNCEIYADQLIEWLSDSLNDPSIVVGSHHDIETLADGSIIARNKITWQEWITNPGGNDYDLSILLPKDHVLGMDSSQLLELVTNTFSRLFPFIQLACLDNPMPAIAEYLGIEEVPKPFYAIREGGPLPVKYLSPHYELETCAEETGIDPETLRQWVKALNRKKQVVLHGPPGTGKTFIAEKLARYLVSGEDGFYQLVQFHPEVSYEDFIQGIRPQPLSGGGLHYPLVPGRFIKFCDKAIGKDGICVLIIDEINRANLARVFGELMYLLEYRDQEVELAAGKRFKIPINVRIIGTMNTADRSIALVDHALRRRFAFLPLYPNYDILRKYHERNKTNFAVENLIHVLDDLNKQIADRHYTIGTSYFLRDDLALQIPDIWKMEIEPYLEEYFFDQPDKFKNFCWDKISAKILQ